MERMLWRNLITVSTVLGSVFAIEAPHNLQARQIWPGEVQVVWAHHDLTDITFVVHYRETLSNSVNRKWERVNVRASLVATLSGLQGNTDYTIKVTALRDRERATSDLTYVFVRDGKPHRPYNITSTVQRAKNNTLWLQWEVVDDVHVDKYIIQIITPNETVTTETTYRKFKYNIKYLNSNFVVKIFAQNKFGSSTPGVVEFKTSQENRRHADPIPDLKSRQPEPAASNDVLIYVLGILGGLILVSLLVGAVLLLRRKTHEDSRSRPPIDDVTAYEAFLRHKGTHDQNGSDIQMRHYPNGGSHPDQLTTRLVYNDSPVSPHRQNGTPVHVYNITEDNSHFRYSLNGDVSPLKHIRELRDSLCESPTSPRRTSPRDRGLTPSSSIENITDSPRSSKRFPIIPIDQKLSSAVDANVDVTKYQLNPAKALNYESDYSLEGHATDSSNIYAKIE